MDHSNNQEYLIMQNSFKMPIIGYGTSMRQEMNSETLKNALKNALDAGYRHVDTAFVYHNEEVIGEVLNEYFESGKLKRNDVFITTKIWPGYASNKELIKKCMKKSLKKLQLEYVNLCLVHSPISFQFISEDNIFSIGKDGNSLFSDTDLVNTVWRGMEDLVDAGLTKSIGVSNFNSQQIERICKVAKHPIVNNQIEVHLLFQQHKLVEFCHKRNITVTAFAPLSSLGHHDRPDTNPLENHVVKKIAKKYRKTEAQILLRFLIERNICVIPKSINEKRIFENFNIFDFKLNKADMEELYNLDCNLRIFKRNFTKNTKEHPEYPFNIEF